MHTGILTTPEGNDEEALAKLFMRIDANCDSTVDWEEFCSYLLLESTGSNANAPKELDCTMEFEQGQQPALAAEAHHKELMSGLCFVPGNGSGPDRWMTTAADGTVRVWNAKVSRGSGYLHTCMASSDSGHKFLQMLNTMLQCTDMWGRKTMVARSTHMQCILQPLNMVLGRRGAMGAE